MQPMDKVCLGRGRKALQDRNPRVGCLSAHCALSLLRKQLSRLKVDSSHLGLGVERLGLGVERLQAYNLHYL